MYTMSVLTSPIGATPYPDSNSIAAIKNRYNVITDDDAKYLYIASYSKFTHATNYTQPPTLSFDNNPSYIMPLTGANIDTLYTKCNTLYTLATNFKLDVLTNNNAWTYTAVSRVLPTDIDSPTLFTAGATSSGSSATNATNLVNGYKQIVYMTDLLIYDLWAFMKSNITDETSSVMGSTTSTPSSLATGLTGIITNANVIQVIVTGSLYDYNFGFNNDTAGNNILKKSEYTSFKKYVFFARDLLTLLSNDTNFTKSNNNNEPLASTCTHKVSETLTMGISALTVAIAALETSYDSRWNVGGKYTNDNTGLYANRNNIESNLKDLYQLPGSKIYTSQANYTSTMVAGTMWTVLASVLVYYIFTEL